MPKPSPYERVERWRAQGKLREELSALEEILASVKMTQEDIHYCINECLHPLAAVSAGASGRITLRKFRATLQHESGRSRHFIECCLHILQMHDQNKAEILSDGLRFVKNRLWEMGELDGGEDTTK